MIILSTLLAGTGPIERARHVEEQTLKQESREYDLDWFCDWNSVDNSFDDNWSNIFGHTHTMDVPAGYCMN